MFSSLSFQLEKLFQSTPSLKQSINVRQILINQLLPSLQNALAKVSTITFSILNIFIFSVSFVSIVGYSLANPQPLLLFYLRLFPKNKRQSAVNAYINAARMTVGWLKTNFIEGIIEGVFSTLFLFFLGVPGALVWGIFTFVSSFIPRLGPYIMTIAPTIVAFTVNPLTALWVVFLYVVLNELVGDVVDPYLRSTQTQINPVLLIFAVFSMTYAFGLLGAFISTPTAGFVKAFYETFFVRDNKNDLIATVKIMQKQKNN